MQTIDKADYSKLVKSDPEHCFCIRCEQGVLTLLSDIELSEDRYRYNEMSFDLDWRKADSIIKETTDVRSRHIGGIYINDCDTVEDAIIEFMSTDNRFVKYVEVADSEFEIIARCYPNDIIYIHIPVETEVKSHERRKRKSKKNNAGAESSACL